MLCPQSTFPFEFCDLPTRATEVARPCEARLTKRSMTTAEHSGTNAAGVPRFAERDFARLRYMRETRDCRQCEHTL